MKQGVLLRNLAPHVAIERVFVKKVEESEDEAYFII
jgi:hypothetical protein